MLAFISDFDIRIPVLCLQTIWRQQPDLAVQKVRNQRNMRVIGGDAKGRRLKVPKGRNLRPTAARVKEALFNILPHDLGGLEILDLFAGTGNMTVESLSRGAAAATLVEVSREAARVIRKNLHTLGVADRCR